jgi:type II secretory pathway pseudopilin PulG
MKSFARSESGFSLIEVMLVSGMVGLMAMSFASIISNQQNAARHLNQTMEANQISEAIRAFLNDTRNCEKNFLNASTSGTTQYTELKNFANAQVFSTDPNSVAGKAVGQTVYVSSIELEGPVYPVPNLGRDAIKLKIDFEQRDGAQGINLRPREIDLLVTAGGTITSCSTQTTKSLICRTAVVTRPGQTTARVYCTAPKRVYSCGFYDSDPDKNGSRAHYSIAPSIPNPGGGCFCQDSDSSGQIRCYAVCCEPT